MSLSGKKPQRALEIAGLIAIAAAGYLIADQTLFDDPVSSALPAPSCTLGTTPCQFDNASASLKKETVAPLIPTELSVEVTGEQPEHLMVELEGVEMSMGTYKLKLTPAGNNLFVGEVMLPICVEAEMTWRGTISSPDRSLSLPVDVRMAR